LEKNYFFDGLDEKGLVYVKSISSGELPIDVQEEILDEQEPLFALHNSTGDRIAVVSGRDAAFVVARQNDLNPVSVH
jgi:hypothetical protein|tara:strand:- start:16 stop:246 length:231 start_codon:yes stop_codon:yes gene_type:complete